MNLSNILIHYTIAAKIYGLLDINSKSTLHTLPQINNILHLHNITRLDNDKKLDEMTKITAEIKDIKFIMENRFMFANYHNNINILIFNIFSSIQKIYKLSNKNISIKSDFDSILHIIFTKKNIEILHKYIFIPIATDNELTKKIKLKLAHLFIDVFVLSRNDILQTISSRLSSTNSTILISMYVNFSINFKLNISIINKIIDNLDPFWLTTFYSLMPKVNKENVKIIIAFIQKVDNNSIVSLYKKFDYNISNNIQIIKLCIDRCYDTIKLYNILSEENKNNIDIILYFISKSNGIFLLNFYLIIPDTFKNNIDIISNCLHILSFSDIYKFYKTIPKITKESNIINLRFIKKIDSIIKTNYCTKANSNNKKINPNMHLNVINLVFKHIPFQPQTTQPQIYHLMC